MRRQVQLRRRIPLRSVRRQTVPVRVRVDVATRSGGRCELVLPHWRYGRCPRPASHMHHRLPRSQGGQHTAANLLHLCSDCHSYVHAHPAESYESGWLQRKGPSA